jgi:hypothetical protein
LGIAGWAILLRRLADRGAESVLLADGIGQFSGAVRAKEWNTACVKITGRKGLVAGRPPAAGVAEPDAPAVFA